MKFRFRRYRSKYEGQIDVRVESADDDVYERNVVVYFDSIGIIMSRIEASAFSAAVMAARSAHGP